MKEVLVCGKLEGRKSNTDMNIFQERNISFSSVHFAICCNRAPASKYGGKTHLIRLNQRQLMQESDRSEVCNQL